VSEKYSKGYADGRSDTEKRVAEEYSKGYADGRSDTEKRIARVLFEAGFRVALELREGDPAIWDEKNKRWVELTEKGKR